MSWREVPRDEVVGQWSALYVTLNPKGQFAMTRVTWKKLGSPKAVRLLFDAANSKIGMKPAQPTDRNAYPLGNLGAHGAKRISAYRLITEFGVDLTDTVAFQGSVIKDGILELNLRTAKISNRGNRARRHPPVSVGRK